MSTLGLITPSRLLAVHLSQILEERGQPAPIRFSSFTEVDASPIRSRLDLLLLDEAGQGEILDSMLLRFEAEPASRPVPILLLHPPDDAARADMLLHRHPSIRAILQKPFAYEEFHTACQSALAPRIGEAAFGHPTAGPIVMILPRLRERPDFVAGFEWDRQSAPMSAEGAPAKPLSEACRLALRLTGSISDSLPVGELNSLAIFGDQADVVLFSARVSRAEPDDFHVLGLLVESGSNPDEWIRAAYDSAA